MRRSRQWLLILGAVLTLVLAMVIGNRSTSPVPKVLVLGFDGLDPQLLRRFVSEGHLPNFQRLSETGSLQELATTDPPQSPVAWSTFITGLEPNFHGIFDFVHRDPETMQPIPSLTLIEDGTARLLREGIPFWHYLEEAGVPCHLIKIPANFPPEEPTGHYLTDMGTPDLEGTYGTYSFYTNGPPPQVEVVRSGGRRVQVEKRNGSFQASFVGPNNDALPFRASVNAESTAALLEIADQRVLLKPGEWSAWLPLKFSNSRGIVRLYLQSLNPTFALYASPVNIDPENPVVPISEPSGFARKLALECGRFYTQGMPEETAGLLDGILSDAEFLQQNQLVVGERQLLFDNALRNFDEGFLFFYVSSTDIISHLYWNATDDKHPGYDPDRARLFGEEILKSYKLADRFLGQALSSVDSRTTLFALSDHGFAPFYRSVHLNRWLRDKKHQKGQGSLMADIDWSRTEAYAVGFNSLYLNLAGREAHGIVSQTKRRVLLESLTKELLKLKDPKTGKPVIATIEQVQAGPQDGVDLRAPDLLIGYHRGYRASWETAVGDAGSVLLEDNKKAWSGDHLMSPGEVPGVLLCNRKLSGPAHLRDLAPTFLDLYKVRPPNNWPGHSLVAPLSTSESRPLRRE